MLCRMSLLIFSQCLHVTFYKYLCRTSFFTHVEPDRYLLLYTGVVV